MLGISDSGKLCLILAIVSAAVIKVAVAAPSGVVLNDGTGGDEQQIGQIWPPTDPEEKVKWELKTPEEIRAHIDALLEEEQHHLDKRSTTKHHIKINFIGSGMLTQTIGASHLLGVTGFKNVGFTATTEGNADSIYGWSYYSTTSNGTNGQPNAGFPYLGKSPTGDFNTNQAYLWVWSNYYSGGIHKPFTAMNFTYYNNGNLLQPIGKFQVGAQWIDNWNVNINLPPQFDLSDPKTNLLYAGQPQGYTGSVVATASNSVPKMLTQHNLYSTASAAPPGLHGGGYELGFKTMLQLLATGFLLQAGGLNFGRLGA